MSFRGKLKRFYLIIEKIEKSSKPPTIKTIKDYLEEQGFDISLRTIERDKEALRDEFGIKIDCIKPDNVYKIDYENSLEVSSFLQILNAGITADVLMNSIKDYNKMSDYIQLDSNKNYKGVDILKDLLFAVKNSREITYSYQPFYKKEAKQHTIQPYLLKEYLDRWYIIGIDNELKEFRTFAIDRIEDLKVLTKTFKRDEKKDPKDLFENIVGLDYSYSDLQKVVLSFTPFQAKYIKTKPLHTSQEIIKDDDKECLMEYTIVPNYEFMQRILQNADGVKVVEPEWLKKEVVDMLKNTLKNYK